MERRRKRLSSSLLQLFDAFRIGALDDAPARPAVKDFRLTPADVRGRKMAARNADVEPSVRRAELAPR
jgi:hypothetical protein